MVTGVSRPVGRVQSSAFCDLQTLPWNVPDLPFYLSRFLISSGLLSPSGGTETELGRSAVPVAARRRRRAVVSSGLRREVTLSGGRSRTRAGDGVAALAAASARALVDEHQLMEDTRPTPPSQARLHPPRADDGAGQGRASRPGSGRFAGPLLPVEAGDCLLY